MLEIIREAIREYFAPLKPVGVWLLREIGFRLLSLGVAMMEKARAWEERK